MSMVGAIASLGTASDGVVSAGTNIESLEIESESVAGMAARDAVSTLLIALVGPALTVLPSEMGRTGWLLAPVLLVLAAALLTRSGALICQCCDFVEEERSSSPDGGGCAVVVGSYEDVAGAAGFFKLLVVTKNAVMLGTVAILISFLTDSIGALFPAAPEGKPLTMIRFLIVLPPLLVLAMVRDTQQLARFSCFGILGVFMQVAGCLVGSVMLWADSGSCGEHQLPDDSSCRRYSATPEGPSVLTAGGMAMSAFVFNFAVLATAPNLRSKLAQPAQMPAAIRTAFCMALLTFFTIMTAGYAAFGQKVPDNIVVGIAEHLPVIGKIPIVGLILNITFSVPIFFLTAVEAFETPGIESARPRLKPCQLLLRASLLAGLTIVSWLLPYASAVMGVVSSIFCVCNNLFFPACFYYVLRSRGSQPLRPSDKFFLIISLLVGAAVMFFGFKGSLEDLLGKLAAAAPPEGSRPVDLEPPLGIISEPL